MHLWLWILALATPSAFAAYEESDLLQAYTLDVSPRFEVNLEKIFGAKPLTAADLEARAYPNYAAFLAGLQHDYPELFPGATFLHTTGSLQPASFARPRVLLYGRGAVLAFSEPENNPLPRVEMIHYEAATNSYATTEIEFPPQAAPRFHRNPTSCIACHGQPVKPLWEPYDLWPKAYGVFAGFFQKHVAEPEFVSFRQNRARLGGIYAALGEPVPVSEGVPSSAGPVAFTQFITTLQLAKTMRALGREPALRPYRYALAAGFAGCFSNARQQKPHALSEFFPAALPVPYAYFLDDVTAGKRAHIAYLDKLYGSLFPAQHLDLLNEDRLFFENDIYAPVRYVLENLGLRWSDYVLTDGAASYTMNVPLNLFLDASTLLPLLDAQLAPETDPSVVALENVGHRLYFNCDTLARRSRAALAPLPVPSDPAQPPQRFDDHTTGLSPMNRCVRCHVAQGFGNAPYIPFENTGQLRQWLREGKNLEGVLDQVSSGKMPKDSALTAEERGALFEVFQRLAE